MAEGRRGSIVKIIAGGGISLLSLYFFLLFFRDSGNLERFLEEKTQVAFREMLWLFAYLFLCLMGFFLKRKMQNAPGKGVFLRREASGEAINRAFLSFLFILPTLVFAYLHRMLLPMLVSGLWLFVLALLFRFITTERPLQIFKDFKRFLAFLEKDFQEGTLYPLVFALPFFILQMNRSNVALDYDSLRYGLRSAYVLFPEGFFSAHGQINSVYSYPKGLELLTYPLNYLSGYGFLLSFSLWTYLVLASVFGLLLFHFQKNRKKLYLGILCFFLLSSVGNMSLTMKTDLFTLLLQLSALYFFLKGKRLQSCFLLFFSYSFKPTAVVFSTLLGIVFLLAMLLEFFGKRSIKTNSQVNTDRNTNTNASINAKTGINSNINTNYNRIQAKGEKWTSELPFVLFSLVYTGLITLRTFLITGLPFSTTFTGIFKAIGFHVNWPFNLDAHVDYSGELSFSESAFSFFRRLFSFLFYPVGEDMAHVAIAWSGVLFPLILLFALWRCFSLGRKCLLGRNSLPGGNHLPGGNSLLGRNSLSGREASLCRGSGDTSPWDYLPLSLSFLVIMSFSLFSFVMLWQIDGNYYILWESLALLLCFSGGNLQEKRGIILLLKAFFFFPFYLAAFLGTITTSWAGAVGFTPIDLANKGYYDHALVELENQGEKGSLPAFSEMAKNPRHHVLAFAETPECYRIPCNVQSITDVEGSGGSPGLYDSPLYFAWFLKWSDTDYVYLEQSFLHDEREERAGEMLLQMAEEGIFHSPMPVERNEILPLERVKAFSESDNEGTEQFLLLQIRKERLEYPWEEKPYPELSPEEQMEKDRILQLLSEYLQ